MACAGSPVIVSNTSSADALDLESEVSSFHMIGLELAADSYSGLDLEAGLDFAGGFAVSVASHLPLS